MGRVILLCIIFIHLKPSGRGNHVKTLNKLPETILTDEPNCGIFCVPFFILRWMRTCCDADPKSVELCFFVCCSVACPTCFQNFLIVIPQRVGYVPDGPNPNYTLGPVISTITYENNCNGGTINSNNWHEASASSTSMVMTYFQIHDPSLNYSI